MVAFSVAPTTTENDDASVTKAVAEAVKVVRDSGLPYELNSMFTIVEGEWDEVFDVIRRATEVVAETAPRTSLVIKADIRPGHTGQLTEKVRRVEEALGESLG